MSSLCFLVVGVPRSGTSCISGLLHKMGVDMGAGHFQGADAFNRRGYFEDLRWRMVTQRVTGRGYDLRAADPEFAVGKRQRRLWRKLAKECAQKPLWGIKDTWMPFVGRWVIPIIEAQGVTVRMIVTERDRVASVASVARHLQKSYKGRYRYGAERIIHEWTAALERTVIEFQGRAMRVSYDRLVADPRRVIPMLGEFVYVDKNMWKYSLGTLADWVTPALKHF